MATQRRFYLFAALRRHERSRHEPPGPYRVLASVDHASVHLPEATVKSPAIRVALSVLVLALAPLPATAAEGPDFLAAYLTDAVGMTEAMVKACTSRHPGLAARGATALDVWRRRNAADARRAAERTARELQNLPMSKEETERALTQLRQEHLEGWQRMAAFPTVCSDYVASLERPESDVARLLSKAPE